MTTGDSTTQLGKEASTVLNDLNTAAQDAIKGDGTGKTAALAKAMNDTKSALSAEGVALVERLVAYEAKSGFGFEAIVSAIVSRIGGLL